MPTHAYTTTFLSDVYGGTIEFTSIPFGEAWDQDEAVDLVEMSLRLMEGSPVNDPSRHGQRFGLYGATRADDPAMPHPADFLRQQQAMHLAHIEGDSKSDTVPLSYARLSPIDQAAQLASLVLSSSADRVLVIEALDDAYIVVEESPPKLVQAASLGSVYPAFVVLAGLSPMLILLTPLWVVMMSASEAAGPRIGRAIGDRIAERIAPTKQDRRKRKGR